MHAVGVAGEAGLEIGVERQIRRFGEVAEVAQRIGPVDRAIALSRGESHAGAGAGERREAERGEIFGRADIERIGNDKTARSRMQLSEAGALFCDRRLMGDPRFPWTFALTAPVEARQPSLGFSICQIRFARTAGHSLAMIE